MRYNPAYAARGISGESAPSDADIKVTRDLIRAGQLLKMELIDHVIIGNGNRSSLRELGYFTPEYHDNIYFARTILTETFSKGFSRTFSKGYVMSWFGKVRSSEKTLAFIDGISYIYA